MEYKAVKFELKDIDKSQRKAVIAHAVYNNIDRVGDISRPGMFSKSWNEHKEDVNFYLNHDDTKAPGKITNLFETKDAAFTEVWLGTHTLGNDVLIMMDEGVIKNASFGYKTEDFGIIEHNGKRVRELKQVRHFETSALTKLPANPLAGVREVVKSLDGNVLRELKEHLEAMEKFCRNTKASDDCIKSILFEIEQARKLLYDGNTDLINQPEPSNDDELKLLNESINLLTLKNFPKWN